MATLRSARGDFKVPCRCLIGRSSLAELRLKSQKASSEHASMGWYSGQWTIRDLGSSNGTTVDGQMLGWRQRQTLAPGGRLRFGGDDEVWTVLDTEAPEACAVALGTQEQRFGQGQLLVLPSPDAPEASLYVERGRWRLDSGDRILTPESGDIVGLPSGYWRLLVPEDAGAGNARTLGYDLDVSQLELAFDVSAARVMVTVKQGAVEVPLPSRACVQTLLVLARVRANAAAHGSDAGWVSGADLAGMRCCTVEKVNVDIHRLRKLFEEAKVHGAANIIERDDAKRLRIGVSRIVERRS